MRQTAAGGNKFEKPRMINVKRIADVRTLQKMSKKRVLENAEWKRFKLIILNATYLNEVDLKGRVDSANNDVNLCHDSIV